MHLGKTGMKNSNWHKALLKANEVCRCGAKRRLSGICKSHAMAMMIPNAW